MNNEELKLEVDEKEREIPSLNSQTNNKSMQKVGMIVILLVGVVAIGAVTGSFNFSSKEDLVKTPEQTKISSSLPPMPNFELPKEEKKEEQKPIVKVEPKIIETGFLAPPPPAPDPVVVASSQEKVVTPEMRKMQADISLFTINTSSQSQNTNNGFVEFNNPEQQADDLKAKLTTSRLSGSSASVMKDRTFFITQGQFLDCVLETAIDSTVSGMVRARLSKNVFSADGKMILLEKGTRLIGQYQRGITQGEPRLFVLWTRAETPKGVIINIDSPGADELGRAGLSGNIDYHFWQRFGSAIMFSLLNDVGAFITDLAKEATKAENTINLGNTAESGTEVAGIALQNSINIPPTLRKNQGDNITIYIARDLDFRGVYGIELTR